MKHNWMKNSPKQTQITFIAVLGFGYVFSKFDWKHGHYTFFKTWYLPFCIIRTTQAFIDLNHKD
jgi:hypothetical protein